MLILNSSIEIKSLNLSFNNLNYNDIKYMLNDVKLSSSLTSLNLSNNQLLMLIKDQFQKLNKLEILDIQNSFWWTCKRFWIFFDWFD